MIKLLLRFFSLKQCSQIAIVCNLNTQLWEFFGFTEVVIAQLIYQLKLLLHVLERFVCSIDKFSDILEII